MKYLWAPWRMNYILGKKEKGCFFCKKSKEKKDRENLILLKRKQGFIMMNRFPYNNGHLMVVPKRHCVDLEQLSRKEILELFQLLQISTRILKRCFHPHGFNIGVNIGVSGGAGEDHIHFHIVPRWAGDTNFMPVVGETKIIPQYLEETYERLRPAFSKRSRDKENQKGEEK